jgi:DNA-binding winged helix-turn-helix (wHTH) protein
VSVLISNPRRAIRFGDFQADLAAGELRKAGNRIKIQDQPMLILGALLERPGELVTREELTQRIWPEVQALDFEHGLNVAVKKLRTALNDSADAPRYIETLPRKGYRFVATIERDAEPGPVADTPAAQEPARRPGRKPIAAGAVAALLIVSAAAISWRQAEPPRTSVLFSGTGVVGALAFSPDGKVIAFGITGPAENRLADLLEGPRGDASAALDGRHGSRPRGDLAALASGRPDFPAPGAGLAADALCCPRDRRHAAEANRAG